MSCSLSVVRHMVFPLLCGFFFLCNAPPEVVAALPTVDTRIIADSDESFDRRIYSYDMQIDSSGNVHIVYSRPYSDRKANVYYVRRVNGVWQNQLLLTPDAFKDNKSTFLLVGNGNLIHVCYIKDEGTSEGLYYRTIDNGVANPEVKVGEGGWWSRMQLDDNDYPMFVRGGTKWPDPASRLLLLTTHDGITWDTAYLDLAPAKKFLIADFLYENGTYHITYGNSEHEKLVWSSKAMTEKVMEIFHDFYYATSTDGVNWTEHLIDNSQTLHNKQFWTSMALVDGRPLIAMYKYAEYNNEYNRGTSTRLSEWIGVGWDHKIITNQVYADTSEGMGVGLAVVGPGDYFGAWDFSPSYPQILPPSPRGNTAMRRSGPGNDWSPVAQLDPFSLEGRAKLKVHEGKLYFLALGDYTDAKLYFHEYSIYELSKILPGPGSTVGPGSKMNFQGIYHMLLKD